jgi:predicted ester cyclase
MSEQENTRIAEKFFEAINAHNLDLYPEILSPDYRAEAPGAASPQNADQWRAYNQSFIDAFPDLHFELRHRIAQGDFVVINWMGSGTHNGPLRTPTGASIPPTGNRAVVPGSTTYQFKGGKVVNSWLHWDMVTLLAQLGLMPGM